MTTSADLLAEAFIVFVFLASAWRWARFGGRGRADVALAFAPLAILSLASTFAERAAGAEAPVATASIVILQFVPYFFLRVTRHAGGIPRGMGPAFLAAAVTASVWTLTHPLTDAQTTMTGIEALQTLAAVFFVPVIGSAVLAGIWVRHAWSAKGVSGLRMRYGAAAGVLFPSVLILATFGTGTLAYEVAVTLLAVCYLVAFAPPRRLRRAWAEREFARFVTNTRRLDKTASVADVEAALARGAEKCFDRGTVHFQDHAESQAPGYLIAAVRQPPEPRFMVCTFAAAPLFPDDEAQTMGRVAGHAAYILHDARVLKQEALGRREAEDLAAFKAQFLRHFGHEVANPLLPLLVQARRLRRLARPEDAASWEIVDRSIQRIVALAKDISAVARVTDPKAPMELADVDLGKLAHAAVQSYGVQATTARCLLDCSVDGEVWARADATRVAQVLDNLLSNAIKYSPRGGDIKVMVRRHDTWATVEVVDQGLGWAAEAGERLFGTYQRLHRVSDPDIPGSGLGLYLCRTVAEQHGGTLTGTSEGPGRGARFVFSLPLATPLLAVSAPTSQAAGMQVSEPNNQARPPRHSLSTDP